MGLYGYEYFSGANVVVEVEGQPLLECAGLSCSIRETKMPIYGYSSRHYDAVARGQVIVQGMMLINYVDNNYVFNALEYGLIQQGAIADYRNEIASSRVDRLDDAVVENGSNMKEIISFIENDPTSPEAQRLISRVKDTLYGDAEQDFDITQRGGRTVYNPHDSFGSFDIKATFGNRTSRNGYNGVTGFLLSGVHITGRGIQVRIDEETIVEEVPFFARNWKEISRRNLPVITDNSVNPGGPEGDEQRIGAIFDLP
jgi:hypothetical protein